MDSQTIIYFPPSRIEALKLHLMNSSYFHKPKSLEETEEMLKKSGDYFIQDYERDSVLLSTRVGTKILEFSINLCQYANPDRVVFRFCDREFASTDELIRYFSVDGNFIEAEGDQFRLLHPIYRATYAGRLGCGEFMQIRDTLDSKKLIRSYVRSLRREFSQSKTIQSDLDLLLLLDNKYLARIRDFSRIDMGRMMKPVVLLVHDAYDQNLYDHLLSLTGPMNARKYVKWCYQVAKGLTYLSYNSIYHRRLHPRLCLLDARSKNVKLSGFWTDNDVDDLYLFQRADLLKSSIKEETIMRRDGWRYTPVETLLNGEFNSASQVWNYGLLMWMIFSHCQLDNRASYSTLTDFMGAGANDIPFHMPGHLTRMEAYQGMPELRTFRMAFYKASEEFPRTPDSLAEVVPLCLAKNPKERPYFSEVFRAVENEHRIFNFSHIISKFI